MQWSSEARHSGERQLLASLNLAQPVLVTDQNQRTVAVNREWESMDAPTMTSSTAYFRPVRIIVGTPFSWTS